MKVRIIVLACVLSALGFSSQMASASLREAIEGGVSGGGGNVMDPRTPRDPVHPEVAEKIIYKAHSILLNYLSQKRKAYRSGKLDPAQQQAYAPIFEAPEPIENLARTRKPLVDDHSPCWDLDHRAVDGSTYSRVPDAICISAYSIAQKTEAADIAPQSVALMVHEYGELLGLTEIQAVQAQSETLKDLRGIAFY